MYLRNQPGILLMIEISFILSLSILVLYIFKKNRLFLIAIPFFFLYFLDTINIGVFNAQSFLDSDLSIHKSLMDMLLDKSLFYNDKVMQVFSKIYPPGYHYILLPFYRLGISVPMLSKYLGMILAFIMPFLFYYLGLVIYRSKDIAFFSGIFAYVPSIWHTVYSGIPRSIGLVLFLLGTIFLFQYRNKNQLLYLIYACIISVALIYIHLFSFMILFIVIALFLILELIFSFSLKEFHRFLRNALLFFIIVSPFLILYIANQNEFLEFTSKSSIGESGFLFSRVLYANIKIKDLIESIGYLPIFLFGCSAIGYLLQKQKINQNQHYLLLINFCILFILLGILFCDKLFFLKAHRFPPFISCFFYLFSLPYIKKIYILLKRYKLFMFATICLTILPVVIFVDSYIKNTGIFPYELHRQDPSIMDSPDPVEFDEIYKVASKIKKIVPATELIACPLRLGDVLRMYSERGVISSWKIGGMMTTQRGIIQIYREQVLNSELLYKNPLLLYNKYKTKYFVFERTKLSQIKDDLQSLTLLYETENISLYGYVHLDLEEQEILIQ